MSAYRNHLDQELVNFLKEGDEAAFTEIYNRYAIPVFYQVNQMLRDRESSQDIVQELFINLWNKSENIKEDANLAGYLYVAARNRVFKLIQKGKVRNDYVSAIVKYATEINTASLPLIDERELSRILNKEIDLLPEKMRQVFEMSRKQNMTHMQIAGALGISDKTVKKQINKALTILRLKVRPYAPSVLIMALLLEK
ncbi:RNA polymerase sigma factor [Pedobacter sp. L105]|uniref:RNA polymerase sigma factor n=1 Tax=Pedobacter sp. L105 TaxID=1641871 RepID=UPI00131CF4DD|nr:RNA polymerase sigma-70 factor [Pedobacter sp. L105]